MTDTETRRPRGRPAGWSRVLPQPSGAPDQSHHWPSQDFVNIAIPVTETAAQHAAPSAGSALWGTLTWPR